MAIRRKNFFKEEINKILEIKRDMLKKGATLEDIELIFDKTIKTVGIDEEFTLRRKGSIYEVDITAINPYFEGMTEDDEDFDSVYEALDLFSDFVSNAEDFTDRTEFLVEIDRFKKKIKSNSYFGLSKEFSELLKNLSEMKVKYVLFIKKE